MRLEWKGNWRSLQLLRTTKFRLEVLVSGLVDQMSQPNTIRWGARPHVAASLVGGIPKARI